ncbi:uncharacterized protein [Anolis sagrei]|uniref:uncharacterized protein isoform X2 n=1 Tax=Anolis sagrei TaxID=38937 RepID=UPI00352095AE
MSPKKNVGGPKGKGPAKKAASKRPPPPDTASSEDEGVSAEDLSALLIRVNELEKERGLAAAAAPRPARKASKASMFKTLLSRVSILETNREASRPTGVGEACLARSETPVRQPEPLQIQAAVQSSSAAQQQRDTASQLDSAMAVTSVLPPVQRATTSSDGVLLSQRRRVLICGHSYVYWAERHARRGPFGQHLGLASLATIEWRGMRGLRWDGLVPMLLYGDCPAPDILLIHLGGNDLGLLKGKALYLHARTDLLKIWERWPHTHIIWSAVIPRLKWPGGGDVRKLEKARKRVNRAIRVILTRANGSYIAHDQITHDNNSLYRADGVHLSDSGIDIFLANIQAAIRDKLGELVGDGD